MGPSHGLAPAPPALGQEEEDCTQHFLPPQLSPLLKVTPEHWLIRSSSFAKLKLGVIVNKMNKHVFFSARSLEFAWPSRCSPWSAAFELCCREVTGLAVKRPRDGDPLLALDSGINGPGFSKHNRTLFQSGAGLALTSGHCCLLCLPCQLK